MDGFINGISSIEKISEIVSGGKEFDSIKPEDYALFSKNKESWKEFFGKNFEQEIPGADVLKKMKDIDKKLSDTDDEYKNCPVNDGEWTGKRGDSEWRPDGDYVPQKQNPERKTWQEILDYFGIEGIKFVNGEPDFGELSKGEVEIDDFSTNRDDNFDQADIKLAEQRGCDPGDVAKWRKEHGYTWHECRDMKTMQKVPSIVHNNIPHSGGVSAAKKGLGGHE